MAINNSLNISLPFTVTNGGFGLTSLTPYAVICGGTTTTGSLQQVSGLGTTGQVLSSNGVGTLPTWENNIWGIAWLINNTLVANRGEAVPTSTATLPSTFAVGDIFYITQSLAASTKLDIHIAAAHRIVFNGAFTGNTLGISLNFTNSGGSVTLLGTVANTEYVVLNATCPLILH